MTYEIWYLKKFTQQWLKRQTKWDAGKKIEWISLVCCIEFKSEKKKKGLKLSNVQPI